jgi:uncharacterized membrane protein
MTSKTMQRIHSLDILKGAIMIIMALDHVRDYFHADAFLFDPGDPIQSNGAIFFTRFITHYCAPIFVLLSGASIALVHAKKGTAFTRGFLLKRGLWLMFADVVLVNLCWTFNPTLPFMLLGVVWAIGLSMLFVPFILKAKPIHQAALGAAIIVFHNMLDSIAIQEFWWAILHRSFDVAVYDGHRFLLGYPLLPWVGVMFVGVALGSLYNPSFDSQLRKKVLFRAGITLSVFFFIIRFNNGYGNANPWEYYDDLSGTLIAFFNPLKYPPSFAYACMTLGPAFIILSTLEGSMNGVKEFCRVFGKVPFAYYLAHIFLIHLLAMAYAYMTGHGWRVFVLDNWVTMSDSLKGYGTSLLGVYTVWVVTVALLYPVSKWYGTYKATHKHYWWLSYL